MAFGGLGGIIGMTGGMVSNAINSANKKPSGSKPSSGGSSSSRPSGSSSSGSSSSKRPGGMSGMLAGMAGMMGSAASGVLGGSSGSRPSGGSTGAVLGGGTAVKPGGISPVKPGGNFTYTDSNGNIRDTTDSTDYYALYRKYFDAGEYDKAQEALNMRSNKLGTSGGWDDAQRYAQAALDNIYGNQAKQQEEDALKQLFDEYAGKQEAITSGIDAGVQQNIANLEAMKPMVQQAGVQANQAVQQSYYDAVNPNGAGAEQRAAMGLSDSGLTESAQIAASNAYQGAVNSNAQNVQNQLAQIDLAIRNAELSGDIATAQQLQAYYDTVLQAGMQAANQIANSNRWALENGQNAYQNAIQNGFAQAGLTGKYNGQLTLAGQQAMREFESMDIANKLATLNLAIQQAWGMKQAEADYLIKLAQQQGQNLDNIYLQTQIDFAKKQF